MFKAEVEQRRATGINLRKQEDEFNRITSENIELIKKMILDTADWSGDYIIFDKHEDEINYLFNKKVLEYFRNEGFSVIVSATHCIIPGCGRNVYSSPDIKLEISW